jgi:hypothetical protein
MTKSELRDKIKTSAKKIWSSKQKSVDLDMPSSGDLSLDDNALPILVKFPELKKVLIDLLTKNYNLFVEDVAWIAPRPTTFQIELKNNQLFYIIHTDRSWIAQVEGKKYYLLNLDEEERAAEAIARLLYFTAPEQPEKEPGEGETPSEETGETPPEETGETPEEETPELPA